MRATSVGDTSKWAEATLTVTNDPTVVSVKVSPASATVARGGTLQLRAAVEGINGASTAVSWSLGFGGMPVGSVDADGLYTAPGWVTAPTAVTVTATAAGGVQGTATLTVVPGLAPNAAMGWVRDIGYLGTKEVAELDAAGVHVTLVDHLGSPRVTLGPNGAIEAEQKYLPFGERLDFSGSLKTAKGFTNHEQTDPSGLIYMQARFYAPMYHRFLSPDPGLDQHFQATQSWNIYSYVMNQPTMMTDPTGMVAGGFGDWLLEKYDAGLDVAAKGLHYGKMVPGLGAGIMIGEGIGGNRADQNGSIHALSTDQRVNSTVAGVGSLALQLVAAGSPATTSITSTSSTLTGSSALALQQATTVVPSATAVAGVAGIAVPALAMTGGSGSGAGFTGGTSSTVGQVKVGKQTVRVDLEAPTGGSSGNLHIQVKGAGAGKIPKTFIESLKDLKSLPGAIRNNEQLIKFVEKGLEKLQKLRGA